MISDRISPHLVRITPGATSLCNRSGHMSQPERVARGGGEGRTPLEISRPTGEKVLQLPRTGKDRTPPAPGTSGGSGPGTGDKIRLKRPSLAVASAPSRRGFLCLCGGFFPALPGREQGRRGQPGPSSLGAGHSHQPCARPQGTAATLSAVASCLARSCLKPAGVIPHLGQTSPKHQPPASPLCPKPPRDAKRTNKGGLWPRRVYPVPASSFPPVTGA